jgi:phage baseplate assembly protein W
MIAAMATIDQSSVDPLGYGLVCPFRVSGNGDLAAAGGQPLLASDIGELLGILGPEGVTPGELPWRGDLGGGLHRLQHRNMHQDLVRAYAEQLSAGALRRWEPRITVGPATIVADTATNTMRIGLRYRTRATIPPQAGEVTFTVEE